MSSDDDVFGENISSDQVPTTHAYLQFLEARVAL
jgi:hypothetical protein